MDFLIFTKIFELNFLRSQINSRDYIWKKEFLKIIKYVNRFFLNELIGKNSKKEFGRKNFLSKNCIFSQTFRSWTINAFFARGPLRPVCGRVGETVVKRQKSQNGWFRCSVLIVVGSLLKCHGMVLVVFLHIERMSVLFHFIQIYDFYETDFHKKIDL